MTPSELHRSFVRGLRELDLGARVAGARVPTPFGAALRAGAREVPIRIVAIGKGAPAMASGALARWGRAVEECLVVAPDATSTTALRHAARGAAPDARLTILRAAHPLPDERSVRAAEACLALVTSKEARRVVVLVSGGASALVCAPSQGISLATKRAVTRALIASGANIQDVNVVRKHLSRIKGGRLAVCAAPNPVLTLVASDVIGGTAADVGSGPSVLDGRGPRAASSASNARARALLRRYAPAFAELPLAPLPRSRGAKQTASTTRIVASPEDLADACARDCRARGVDVRVLAPSVASVDELAEEYLTRVHERLRARARPEHPMAFVRAAEPSLVVGDHAGRGGRSTHLVALVGRALGERAVSIERRVLFAALASDGVDGTSGCGGAIVDGRFASRVARKLGDGALDRALARFDTGPLHRRAGSAVASRPTGQNLADLHVLLLA